MFEVENASKTLDEDEPDRATDDDEWSNDAKGSNGELDPSSFEPNSCVGISDTEGRSKVVGGVAVLEAAGSCVSSSEADDAGVLDAELNGSDSSHCGVSNNETTSPVNDDVADDMDGELAVTDVNESLHGDVGVSPVSTWSFASSIVGCNNTRPTQVEPRHTHNQIKSNQIKSNQIKDGNKMM
jgi:hypothetical protein